MNRKSRAGNPDHLDYNQKHYEANKDRYRERAKNLTKQYRARNKAYVDEIKGNTPCADCNRRFDAICMDFDHVNDDKLRAVSRLVRRAASIATLDAEIAKCEVVCSNCHRIRTRDRAVTATV